MRKVIDRHEAIGKTIESISFEQVYPEAVFIHLNDGTSFGFQLDSDYDTEFISAIQPAAVNSYNYRPDELRIYGLVTAEEQAQLNAKDKHERMTHARERARRQLAELRMEYPELFKEVSDAT